MQWKLYVGVNISNPTIMNYYQRSMLFLEMGVLVALFLAEGLVDQARWPYELLRHPGPSYVQ